LVKRILERSDSAKLLCDPYVIKNTHPDQIQSTTSESEQQSSESELERSDWDGMGSPCKGSGKFFQFWL